MTTQEVANSYVALANQNKWVELQDQFHDDNVICREPEHVVSRGVQIITQGKEAVKTKGAANREMMEALHSQYCSEPIVAGDFFSVVLKRDVTFKTRGRVQVEEIGVFQVKDGKIILEQFFY